MALSADITEVLSEVGVRYEILKPDGLRGIFGYLDITTHPEHTTVAIREHFLTGTLTADTQAVEGDILELSSGLRLILTTILPEFFEDDLVDYQYAGWVCNVQGKFQRMSDEPAYDSDYNPVTPGWVDLTSVISAAQIPVPSARSQFQQVQEYFIMELNHDLVYVSDYYDVRSGDRWWISDDNYYDIEFVSKTLMKGLNVCTLKFDAR